MYIKFALSSAFPASIYRKATFLFSARGMFSVVYGPRSYIRILCMFMKILNKPQSMQLHSRTCTLSPSLGRRSSLTDYIQATI